MVIGYPKTLTAAHSPQSHAVHEPSHRIRTANMQMMKYGSSNTPLTQKTYRQRIHSMKMLTFTRRMKWNPIIFESWITYRVLKDKSSTTYRCPTSPFTNKWTYTTFRTVK